MVVDALALATLITVAVLSGLDVIINLFSALKSGHFHSKCFGCDLEMDDDPPDVKKK